MPPKRPSTTTRLREMAWWEPTRLRQFIREGDKHPAVEVGLAHKILYFASGITGSRGEPRFAEVGEKILERLEPRKDGGALVNVNVVGTMGFQDLQQLMNDYASKARHTLDPEPDPRASQVPPALPEGLCPGRGDGDDPGEEPGPECDPAGGDGEASAGST